MRYCGREWYPRKACAKAVAGRKEQPAQVAERRQDASAGGGRWEVWRRKKGADEATP